MTMTLLTFVGLSGCGLVQQQTDNEPQGQVNRILHLCDMRLDFNRVLPYPWNAASNSTGE